MTFRKLLEQMVKRPDIFYKKVNSDVYEIRMESKSGEVAGTIVKTGFDKVMYDVEIAYGDFKDFKRGLKTLSLAKAHVQDIMPHNKVEDANYRVYHSSYTRAIQEVGKYAKKLKLKFDEDGNEGEQLAHEVGMGPSKPKNGKTNKFSFDIYKSNKMLKQKLQVQIYGDQGDYELNMYIL